MKAFLVLIGLASLPCQSQELSATETPQKKTGVADCSFQANPDEFLSRQGRIRQDLYSRTVKLDRSFARAANARPKAAAEIQRRNLVDEEIFGKLARLGVAPAALSSDEEFLRRVSLDLTGRVPTPAEIRSFLADDSETKRDEAIDRLLYSRAFIEYWSMWFGDLLQNVAFPANFDRQYDGRNAFNEWIRLSIAREKSIKDIAYQAVSATGNNYNGDTGAANFPLNAITPMGPTQDMFDTMLNKTAATFLGLSHYDCLLCHNGRAHLDQVSLWGAGNTRYEAQRMAAFFSRMRFPKPSRPTSDFYYNSYDVTDQASGTYDLNTNYGNRPDRTPYTLAAGPMRNLTPEYRVTGATPSGGNWRAAFADNMVLDPMFARNFANRLWKQMFNLALAEPLDALDPARLDPANPPDAPWTLQATHPELLEKLAQELVNRDFNLREFLRLLAQSSAYQLSSRYDGDWKYDYITLFARHYPRRLEGEEIHDAIMQMTGVGVSYTVRGMDNVTAAIRLPEPVEPRSNGANANFMNVFLRGNRDTQLRSQNGSILQQLALMNDRFVRDRIRVAASPTLAAIAKMTSNDAAIDELFLLFLGRSTTDYERQRALEFLAQATPALRSDFIEDLAWMCINKVDFIFSY